MKQLARRILIGAAAAVTAVSLAVVVHQSPALAATCKGSASYAIVGASNNTGAETVFNGAGGANYCYRVRAYFRAYIYGPHYTPYYGPTSSTSSHVEGHVYSTTNNTWYGSAKATQATSDWHNVASTYNGQTLTFIG